VVAAGPLGVLRRRCRPNSPPQTTSVESSSPRRFRSFSSPAMGFVGVAGVLGVVLNDVAVGVQLSSLWAPPE